MAGTKVLVTGGAGKIGRRLVEALVGQGDDVVVVDLRVGDVEGVQYIKSPLGRIAGLEGAEVVYHLAASIDYKASDAELRKRNVEPTKHLLNLCSDVKQFILMSTTSVYGESAEPLTEESKTKPYSSYGRSKLACEKLVKGSSVPYTILRSSQVFGPEFEAGYIDVLKHLRDGDMRIFRSGRNFIPLVHVDDLISALILVKGNKKAINETFNVDGDYRKTQREFMEMAARLLGIEPPRAHVNPLLAKIFGRFTGKSSSITEYSDKLSRNRLVSIEKIRGQLGFEPKVVLEDGMKDVIEAFKMKKLI